MLKGREISDGKFQLDSLDGLRGLAVLLVFLSHMSNHDIYLLPSANFSGAGKSGVFLFFILSSFLLTFPFLAKGPYATSREFLLNYAVRRFLRIYPLYFLYLLAGLASSILVAKLWPAMKEVGVPFHLSFDEFIAHLFLQEGKGVTWSILVEFRYYFVLPIVGLVYARISHRSLWPPFLLVLALVGASQLAWPQAETDVNDIRLGPYLPIFFIGSFLAVLHYRLRASRVFQSPRVRLGLDAAGMLALVALVLLLPSVTGMLLGRPADHTWLHRQFVIFSMLWSIVLIACTDGAGMFRRVFEFQPLRYLGFISFSVYLLHVTAPGVVSRILPDSPFQGWAILLVTVVASHVTWTLIEKPASKWHPAQRSGRSGQAASKPA